MAHGLSGLYGGLAPQRRWDTDDMGKTRGQGAADTPGRGGPVGGPLGGLPAPGPGDLGSGDLGSGGRQEVGEADGGGSVDGPGDLGTGDLTGAGGGQGVKDPISRTPEEALIKNFQGGGGQYLPLSFKEVLKQIEYMGKIANEDPSFMLRDLAQKKEKIRGYHLVDRAWIWIKMLFPDQLNPGPQASQKACDEAKGSETTFLRRLGSLWEYGGEGEIIEAVRLAQKKHREAARPRSRIRDPVRVVVNEMNERIRALKTRNKAPPDEEKKA